MYVINIFRVNSKLLYPLKIKRLCYKTTQASRFLHLTKSKTQFFVPLHYKTMCQHCFYTPKCCLSIFLTRQAKTLPCIKQCTVKLFLNKEKCNFFYMSHKNLGLPKIKNTIFW